MLRLRSLRPFLPVALTTLALACSSDSGDGVDGHGGHGGAGGTTTKRTLSQDGGEISTGNVTLDFPAGAVLKDTEITVTTLDSDEVESLPQTSDGVKLAGVPTKFTPHGLTFEQPVDVTMDFKEPAEDLPLVAMKLDNDQDTTWEVVPGAKFESGEAKFQINGFSVYAVFEDPNGVAGELYGPDAQGSGGTTGSGGDGSGGEDTGGTDNGGSSVGGGEPAAGGGAPSAGGGGQGGTAGGPAGGGGVLASGGVGGGTGATAGGGGVGGGSGGGSASNGYLWTPTIRGYGQYAAGPGATATSDVSSKPTPNCVWGDTSSAANSYAYVGYKINQNEFPPLSAPNPPAFMAHDGLWFTVDWNTGPRPLVVELVNTTAGKVWCAPTPATGALEFVPWENFNDNCVTGEGASFERGTDQVTHIYFKVPSTLVDQGFDYCIDDLSTGGPVWAPPGYLNGPEWFGHGFTVADATSGVSSTTLATTLAPNCATGFTGDVDGFAGLHYYISQPQQSIHSAVELTGEGIQVGVNWNDGRALNVEIRSDDLATTWCAPMPGPGHHFIPYSAFDTNCQGEGAAFPLDTPVDSVGVVAPGTETQDQGFDFCINELHPGSGGPVGPPPGYLNGPDWYGHGFVVSDGISVVVNDDLDTNPFPNCADGTTSASPSAFAGLQYNVNQAIQGTNSPIFLQGQGVIVNVDWDELRPLYARITSSTQGTSWCAPIPGSGSQTIPKEAFNTECVNMTGNPLPGEVLIDSVGIVALSTGVLDDEFAFCVSDLRQAMGGGPAPNGYLQNPEWHGFGFEETGIDTTMTSDLAIFMMPNCANGETGPDPGSFGAIFYAVNESQAGGDNSPVTINQNGVWVDFMSGTPRQHLVKVVDSTQSRSWCALLPSNGPNFVPWSNFSDDCADLPSGAPPIPGVDQIDAVGIVAASTGQQEVFDFCINNLQPMPGPPIPNGYLNGPDWFGYGVAFTDALSTRLDDLATKPAPNCIWGETDSSPGAVASLSYRVNESIAGGDNQPINLGGDGLTIGINSLYDREIRVELLAGAESTSYCSLFPGGSGTFQISWTDFNDTCWTTGGTTFNPIASAVDEIGITVISSGIESDPYDVCITQLENYEFVD